MPGNEVGDTIHNFLGGESLSQGQHHSQFFDGNWSGLNDNLWVGSQTQVDGPLNSSLKNFSLHQIADADRGHNGQPSSLQHSLNFTQSGLRPDSARSQSQNQSTVSGYMQGHQAFQTRQNETNFLGVNTSSQGPDLHKNNSRMLESTDTPVDYDFFGGQRQIIGQHPGMIQPLPMQQVGRTDLQLLQQHAMLKKMQELQRQQLPKPQFQLPEGRQLSSVNEVSSVVKQGSDNLSSAPINGVPVHSASNHSWQPEHMTVNANWLQDGASPAMQGSNSGFLFSPEQGQVHLMGLGPQKVDQSFYGISTSGAIADQYSSVQMEKPLMQQVQSSSNSFSGNEYAMFPEQVSSQDGYLVLGQGDQGKKILSENLQQKNSVMQESSGSQSPPGPSETSWGKSLIQAAPPQAVATLDPTEEKILFGSDDSVWDLFVSSANAGSVLDGMDYCGAFPSLQSGSWSALMQSAVAESSSNDVGIQEEWSGLGMQNSEPPSGNMPTSIVNYGSKLQSALADSGVPTASTLNSKSFPMSQRFVKELTEERSKQLDCSPTRKPVSVSAELLVNVAHSPGMQVSAKSISGHQQGLTMHSPRGQPCKEANGWNSIDSASHTVGTISKSQDVQRSLQASQNSDQSGSMYEESGHGSGVDLTNIESGNVNSGLGNPQVNREGSDLDSFAAISDSKTKKVTKESSQKFPESRNPNLWKSVDSQVNHGPSRVPAKYQQHQERSPESFGGFVPNNTSPTSQNILELFQKVDQPRECGAATHLSSSEHNLSSEIPDAETSDGSVGQFQHNRPTTSQGFGLQLGPPSQKFTIPDRQTSSQSSPQGVNSLNLVHVSSDVGRKGHTWLGTTASDQSSTRGASHGDVRSNVSSVSGQTSYKASESTIQGNVSAGFTANYPYLKTNLQRQHVTSVGSQVTPNESVNAPFGGSSVRAQPNQVRKSAPGMPKTAPDDNFTSSEASWSSSSNQNHARNPGQHFPVLEASGPSTTYESSQQGASTRILPNLLSGVKNSLASQNLFKPDHWSNLKSEASHPRTKKLDDQIAQAGGCDRSEFPADSAKPQSFLGEKQPAKAQQVLPMNDACQNPATMQSDIEAFGRSSRPNNAVNQNYLLLHQVRALENIDTDPSNRSVERFKGPDSELDAQQVGSHGQDESSYGSGTFTTDGAVNCPLDPSGNSKMPSFSSNAGDNHERQLSSDGMLASSQSDSKHFSNATNSAANLKGGHFQMSPKMAPSRFDWHGMFRSGQMMPYDARKIAMMKATEKAFIIGRPSHSLHPLDSSEQVNAGAGASQLDNARQSSNLMPISSDHISSQSRCPDVTNQNLAVVRAKKRKSTTFELFLPWNREITRCSEKPLNISVAEAEWAHAANRLIERVDDEPGMTEDWSPVLRSKRRLILTTQLMQQLLRAPPRVVFSADASKNYETVAYFVARSVLGDACGTSYIPESDTADPPDGGSFLSEKLKEEKNESILKVAEEIIIRAKKLENLLQRLDKRASILDLRLECQDLEKVSVINRFAKFHSRGQADGAGTSSHKFFPQRYVTALPMPRNLPDRNVSFEVLPLDC